MSIIIEHIGFSLIETSTKLGKDFKSDNIEVHYIAFLTSNHEVRGMITVPYCDHICLPEIKRQIGIQLKFTQ